MDEQHKDVNREVVIEGLSLFDVTAYIYTKNRKFQALFLNDLEEILHKDSQEFKLIRKLFLDTQNNFTRSIIRSIFGDIEIG